MRKKLTPPPQKKNTRKKFGTKGHMFPFSDGLEAENPVSKPTTHWMTAHFLFTALTFTGNTCTYRGLTLGQEAAAFYMPSVLCSLHGKL